MNTTKNIIVKTKEVNANDDNKSSNSGDSMPKPAYLTSDEFWNRISLIEDMLAKEEK